MSSQTATLGANRTGIATSKDAAQRMVEGTAEFPPEAIAAPAPIVWDTTVETPAAAEPSPLPPVEEPQAIDVSFDAEPSTSA